MVSEVMMSYFNSVLVLNGFQPVKPLFHMQLPPNLMIAVETNPLFWTKFERKMVFPGRTSFKHIMHFTAQHCTSLPVKKPGSTTTYLTCSGRCTFSPCLWSRPARHVLLGHLKSSHVQCAALVQWEDQTRHQTIPPGLVNTHTAVQTRAVQCSAVQCSAVQCSAVQCSAVQCSAVYCSALQCSEMVVSCCA